MTQSVFDAEIELYQKELGEIIEKMDQTATAFVVAAIACLKQWYQDTAKWFVQTQYERTNELGVDTIRQMKTQVMRIVMMVPNEAKPLLADENLWWHRSRGGGWQDSFTPGPPDGLSMAVCALAERLNPILETYGYLEKDSPPVKRPDEKRPRQAPKKRFADRLQVEWSKEMTKHIEEYKEDLSRATFLDNKMEQARKKKARHTAGLIWEDA